MASTSSSASSGSKVKVLVRVRPFLSSESKVRCLKIEQGANIEGAKKEEKKGYFVELKNLSIKTYDTHRYFFDAAYGEEASQEEIFKTEIEPNIPPVLKGLNTTILAYGNTGAGKTFTMQGSETNPGIIQRSAENLLDLVAKSPETQSFSVYVSYLEIYNEKVFDLLRPGTTDLPIREDASRQIVIPNLSRQQIKTFAEFQTVYEAGCRNRKKGATKLNANSSRSHAILLITVQKRLKTAVQTSKLHLIDLAGSEDNRKTDNKGVRLTESSSINTSLFALAKVVNALNDGSSRIPYRDSKLTRLLSDSLGGSSFGIMIANVSPAQAHYYYTYHTLNFASKSRLVVNNPTTAPMITLDSFGNPTEGKSELPRSDSDRDIKRRPKFLAATASSSQKQAAAVPRSSLASSSSSSSLNKTSTSAQQIPDLDAKIEEAIKAKLKQIMSNPAIRNNKNAQAILGESMQERLEKLEQLVLEQTSFQIDSSIEETLPWVMVEEEAKKTDDATKNEKDAITKAKQAQTLINRAKRMEKSERYEFALTLYEQALALLPDNNQLKKKISHLKKVCIVNEDDEENRDNMETEAEKPSRKRKTAPKSSLPKTSSGSSLAQEDKENRSEVANRILEEDSFIAPDDPADSDYTGPVESDDDSDDDGSSGTRKKTKKGSSSNNMIFIPSALFSSAANQQPETDPAHNAAADAKLVQMLNEADYKQLIKMHDIGPKRAKLIIEFRADRQFKRVDDLLLIGFGEKMLKNFVEKNRQAVMA